MSEILIVGAGPIGLSLAIECARHGLSYRVIDRLPAPSDKSKALGIWSATQELFSAMGVVDEILAAAVHLKGIRICRGTHTLLRIVPGHEVDTPYPNGLILPQCDTERILTSRLAVLGGHVERDRELVSYDQDDLGVTAQVRASDGGTETIRSAFLVGCDGGRSIVRQYSGVTFQGQALEETFVLCDTEIEGDSLTPSEAHIFQSPYGPLPMFPLPNGQWRVISNRGASAELEPPTLEEMQRHVDECGPGGLILKNPTWLSAFRVSERQVDRYVSGRIALAGDAAHIHSPAGGQGMNTGIQDAYNLGWKLALIRRQGGDPQVLLESYEAERRPIAALVIARAAGQTRANLLKGSIAQFIRNAIMTIGGHTHFITDRLTRSLSGLDLTYRESPILPEDHYWPLSRRKQGFAPGARPRDVSVMSKEGTKSLFREIQGTQHALLLFSGCDPVPRDYEAMEKLRANSENGSLMRVILVWGGSEAGAPSENWLFDEDLHAHRRYGMERSGLYLMRPDGYVAVRTQPFDFAPVDAYFKRLCPMRAATQMSLLA